MRPQQQAEKPALDLSEKGRKDGQLISLDRRLFMQFSAFGGCRNVDQLISVLQEADIPGVLYLDVNDAQGIGLLTFSEDPSHFVSTVRTLLNSEPFSALQPKPEYAMLGRTYTIGYESNLESALIDKPRQKVLSETNQWGIWYPLQRAKTFETMDADEQKKILGEHGGIGMTFGRAGLATDIRLASYGLDKNDNDFVIGLLGKDLFPLSAVVQAMRKTQQTAFHLDSLGPFFVGKVAWQSEDKSA